MITQFCCFRLGDEAFVRYQDILFYEITSILIAYTQSHVDFQHNFAIYYVKCDGNSINMPIRFDSSSILVTKAFLFVYYLITTISYDCLISLIGKFAHDCKYLTALLCHLIAKHRTRFSWMYSVICSVTVVNQQIFPSDASRITKI